MPVEDQQLLCELEVRACSIPDYNQSSTMPERKRRKVVSDKDFGLET